MNISKRLFAILTYIFIVGAGTNLAYAFDENSDGCIIDCAKTLGDCIGSVGEVASYNLPECADESGYEECRVTIILLIRKAHFICTDTFDSCVSECETGIL